MRVEPCFYAGSLGSHAAVEQLRPLADKETSPAAGEPAQRAMPAASANMGTSLPMGTPPLHPAARLGSSSLRNRPSLPPFAAGLVHTSKSAAAAPQNGIVLQQNGEHEPLRYTGSSPLQLPPTRSPHQAVAHEGLSIPDADHPGVRSSIVTCNVGISGFSMHVISLSVPPKQSLLKQSMSILGVSSAR